MVLCMGIHYGIAITDLSLNLVLNVFSANILFSFCPTAYRNYKKYSSR